MPTDVFIYSKSPLACGRDEIEDAVDDALQNSGEVTGGGSGESGWNIDIELNSDRDLDQNIAAIVNLLREHDVPEDTYLLVGGEQRRVPVHANGPL